MAVLDSKRTRRGRFAEGKKKTSASQVGQRGERDFNPGLPLLGGRDTFTPSSRRSSGLVGPLFVGYFRPSLVKCVTTPASPC